MLPRYQLQVRFFLFASTQMSFSLKEYVEKSRTRAVLCNFQTFVGLVLD